MESSTFVVIALTFVLVIAVVAALYVFVIAPNFYDGGDGGRGGDRRWRRDRDEEPEISDVVRGVNHALQSGYDYDMHQDEKLKEADKGHKHQEAAITSNSQKIKELEQQLKSGEGAGKPPGAGSVAANAIASGIGAAAGAYMANGGWKSWGGGGDGGGGGAPSTMPALNPSQMQGPSGLPATDAVSQEGGGSGGVPKAVADAFANDAFAESFAAY